MGLTVTNIGTPNARLNQFSLGPWNARFIEVAWDSTYAVGGELLTAASLGWNQLFGAIQIQPPTANDGALAYVDFGTAITNLNTAMAAQATMVTALAAGAAGDLAASVHLTDVNGHLLLAREALERTQAHVLNEEWVLAAVDLDTYADQLALAADDYTLMAADLVDDAADTHIDDAVVHLDAAAVHAIDAATDLAAGAPIAAGTDLIAFAVDFIDFAIDIDNAADDIVQAGATAAGIAAAVAFDNHADNMDLAADHMVAGTLFRTANVAPTSDFKKLRFELASTASVEVLDDVDMSLFKGRFLVFGY